MKVTTKGQVTIPMEIRERLGIHPGTEVEFAIDGTDIRLHLITLPARRGRQMVERMRGKGSLRMTTDEIMALTRGEQ